MKKIFAVAGIVIKELYRRKDVYVVFVLTAVIALMLLSVNVFNDTKVVRYLKEITLLLIWISSLVIAITTAARQIPQECESRTVFPLLAKPLSRAQFVLGKFVGTWLAVGASLLVFYLFFLVLTAPREAHWPVGQIFQAATLHWAMLAVVIAFTLFGSLVFAAPSSNATITFVLTTAVLVLARHLNQFALQMHEPMGTLVYGIYYLVPHLEFFDVRDLVTHDWPVVNWLVWGGALIYAAVYSALFLLAAHWKFQRKALV